MTAPDRPPFAPIAIVGMAGRFPDAGTLEEFWANLAAGHESLRDFSDAELRGSGVDPRALNDPQYVKRGTILDDCDLFDAAFFGLNPREAEALDPQHRLMLEVAWHALEDSGHAGDPGRERVGVFVGASINTYIFANLLPNPAACAAIGPYQIMLASDKDYLATRVAYKMDLRGPALTVQTACSTSLVAVQVACEHLRARTCDMALAGGVSLTFPLRTGYMFTEGMILSRDGHCRPFDADASGTRPGAGAGVVVLRRLDDALRDRDHIRAVILGAAANNDGSRKIGYTAPSIEGQVEVIRQAQSLAEVAPDSISYIEAHGTATALGDPIELTALNEVFTGAERGSCTIGALKSNIGHLDAAAGVAGLIKTVLSLEHGQLPPTLHYRRSNPQFDLDRSPFKVGTALADWSADRAPRRAGVSSFGIGGTNAHVVLEEAPPPPSQVSHRSTHLLTLSARSEPALAQLAGALADWLETHPGIDLGSVAYTLHVGRRSFPHRAAIAASSIDDAVASLRARARQPAAGQAGRRNSTPVAFMFTGQGSQHAGMARDLLAHEPTFAAAFNQCLDLLRDPVGCDLRTVLYPSHGAGPTGPSLDQTGFAQPVLFALEYALAQMWIGWGVRPHAMIGHSLGEYVAACIAGVFTLEQALTLVAARARIMQSMAPGAMLSIGLPAHEVADIAGSLSIAAVNAPRLTVVAGTEARIADLERLLQARGIVHRRLRTSHAFHSELMAPAVAPLAEVLRTIPLRPPQIPYVSNLSGTWIRPEEATSPDYWTAHLLNTVKFGDGVTTLAEHGAPALLEVGAGDVLCALARQSVRDTAPAIVSSLPGPQDTAADSQTIMQALGRLWAAGAAVDWAAVHADERLSRVPLALYPFERQRYWVDPRPVAQQNQSDRRLDIADWFYAPAWTRTAALTQLRTTDEQPGEAYLVFAPGHGSGRAIADAVKARRKNVWIVEAGDRFSLSAERRLTVDPLSRPQLDQALQAVLAAGASRLIVIHAWTASDVAPRDPEEDAFYGPMLLAQALIDAAHPAQTDVVFLSSGMHAIGLQDGLQPHKALLTGVARVLPQEQPQMGCVSIDVPLAVAPEDVPAMVDALLAESGESGCRRVALREGYRWEEGFVPLHTAMVRDTPLRHHGVYLITGGIGGIGLTIAELLARECQARLALTTRRAFPDRARWPALAASGESGEFGRTAAALLALEREGAEIEVLTADAGSAEGMADAVSKTRARFGNLHGIVHAAGISGGGMIARQTPLSAAPVLAAKVTGTMALTEEIQTGRMDFVMLCSSVNAIFGGPGSVEYTAANAFMDAFAEEHSGLATRVVSVNWDAWSEVGMAARTAAADPRRAGTDDRYAIRPGEGAEAFKRVLSLGRSRVAVVTRSLPGLIEVAVREQAKATERDRTVVRPDTASDPATAAANAELNATEQRLIAIWQELLGVPHVSVDDDFFALGGHSLLATGVLARIRQQCGVHLTLRALFDAPTVRSLAARVQAAAVGSAAAVSVDAPEDDREEVEL